MSDHNVDVVRRVIAHVNETWHAGPLDLYDPDVTFRTRGEVGGSETFTGHQGLARAVEMFREAWAQANSHVVEFIEGDDVVVAVLRIELRSHAGIEMEVEEAWAYWLRDGRIVRIEQHGERGAALEAVGLSGT
jgi:ketosteroid isomerase-like protein